jgi:hypothetical protein
VAEAIPTVAAKVKTIVSIASSYQSIVFSDQTIPTYLIPSLLSRKINLRWLGSDRLPN